MKKFNICNKTADTSLCFAANIVWRPCGDSSHVTTPYKVSFYYYYYYTYAHHPRNRHQQTIDNVTHSQRVTRSGVVFPSNKATVYTYIYARHKYYLELSHMAGAVNSIIIIRWWYQPKYLVAASTALLTAPIWLMAYWYHGIDSLDLSDIVRHTQSA